MMMITFINPRPPGGGVGSDPPPRFFVNNFRFVTDIDAKLRIPFRTSILRMSWKFWTILSKKILSYIDFSDPMFCHFWSKNNKCLKNCQKSGIRAKCKRKKPKDIKWTGFQNGYLGFSKKAFFTPQKIKNQLFRKIFDKIKNVQNFQKNRNICWRAINV